MKQTLFCFPIVCRQKIWRCYRSTDRMRSPSRRSILLTHITLVRRSLQLMPRFITFITTKQSPFWFCFKYFGTTKKPAQLFGLSEYYSRLLCLIICKHLKSPISVENVLFIGSFYGVLHYSVIKSHCKILEEVVNG